MDVFYYKTMAYVMSQPPFNGQLNMHGALLMTGLMTVSVVLLCAIFYRKDIGKSYTGVV